MIYEFRTSWGADYAVRLLDQGLATDQISGLPVAAWSDGRSGGWQKVLESESIRDPFFAWIRGDSETLALRETARFLGRDDDGCFYRTVTNGTITVRIHFDADREDIISHNEVLRERFQYRHGWAEIDRVVPERFRCSSDGKSLTRMTIAPFVPNDRVPISAERQQQRIDNHLQEWPTDLRGLLLYGPFNTSKTTFVAAYVTDVITERVAATEYNGYGDFTPCVWRISLNEWLDGYREWRTRDFENGVREPGFLTTAEIRSENERMNLPPVLWVEELDKVRVTDTNHNWIHTLIDCVYQLGGCIVATTNENPKQLRDRLGEGIVGRLDGSRDRGEKYVCLNFGPPKSEKKT